MKITINVNENDASGKFWLDQVKSKGVENNAEYDAKKSEDDNIYTINTANGVVRVPWVLCKEVR